MYPYNLWTGPQVLLGLSPVQASHHFLSAGRDDVILLPLPAHCKSIPQLNFPAFIQNCCFLTWDILCPSEQRISRASFHFNWSPSSDWLQCPAFSLLCRIRAPPLYPVKLLGFSVLFTILRLIQQCPVKLRTIFLSRSSCSIQLYIFQKALFLISSPCWMEHEIFAFSISASIPIKLPFLFSKKKKKPSLSWNVRTCLLYGAEHLVLPCYKVSMDQQQPVPYCFIYCNIRAWMLP